MNLVHLTTLAAIARTGSFVGAARDLRLPPSTVTGHIAALEAALGVQLVARTTRAVRMTSIGARLAEDGQRIADLAGEAASRVAAEKASPGGIVRLSLPFALAHDVIGPVVGRFLAANPGITVDLHLSNARDDLIADSLDLAIRVGPLTGQSLHRRLLFRASLVFCGPPGAAAPERLADLADLPFLGFTSEVVVSATGPAGRETVTLRPRLLANDPRTLARAAAARAGFALLPRVIVRDMLDSGALAQVLPDYRADPVDVSLISHGRTRDTPAVSVLAEFLVAETARLDGAREGFPPLRDDPI
jgi:DNA-binding transcriptional LysR family regulator